MAAIQNKIYLRAVNDSTYSFTGKNVISVEPAESVDIMANKLAVDVAEITIEYNRGSGPDIRALPYGTPVWHYIGSTLQRKMYVNTIDRLTKTRYKINAISAIGILDKQYHKGGVYTGTTVASLLTELIDGTVPYTYDTDVGETKIFGWLPYATKRENLHQILFAENISIVRNANGDMHFTFLRPGTPVTIPESRIFQGASVNYPSVATRIDVTEHSFQYVSTNERVTLIDNANSSPASHKLFVFDTAPVYLGSILADGLTVEEVGVNYAIVSGQGTLTGIPYYDKKSTVTKTRSSGGQNNTVSISDITLITGINSENVAERMLSYYTSRETVQAEVKLDGEKVGGIYSFVDKFGDTVQAYLGRITAKISSFVRANCEFISGYVPSVFGNNFTHWAYVTGNGYIDIQPGTTIARFVIIGGGSGGSSGLKGKDDFSDLQAGSIGGEGGIGGNGGKIKEVVLRNPTPGRYICSAGAGGSGGAAGGTCGSPETRAPGGPGGVSKVTTPSGTVYSSNDSGSYYSKNGIKNLFTEDVYAVKGRNGCKGGNGGRGSVAGNGEQGENVVWDGVTYAGGIGGRGLKFEFSKVKQVVTNGGAGGWGAQPYRNGANGGSVTLDEYHDMKEESPSQYSTYQAYEYGKFGQAEPASGIQPSAVIQDQNYGEGGDGGHGGAGRGGFGSANDYYQSSTDPTTNKKMYLNMTVPLWEYTSFQSSNGGAGNAGKKGIILCYADKELFF